MDPIFVLFAGMVVVVGSVLGLKLHAFLALLAGAFVVAAATPTDGIFDREVHRLGWQVESVSSPGLLQVELKGDDSSELLPGRYEVLHADRLGRLESNGHADFAPAGEGLRLVVVDRADGFAMYPSIKVGDWLIESRDFDAATALYDASWAERIATGFGATCAKIGIVIALAAVIGCCLLDSGAANRIVRSMRNALGERNTPAALLLSGFVIGIPVYFDTVFYLLLPLARALGKQSGRNYLLYILSIIVGATMAHSLVPPTPGPLLVASELNVGLGEMILAGLLVGIITAGSGFLFALWVNRRMTIPIRDVEGQSSGEDMDAAARVPESDEPPLWLALLPIALPVVLLSLGTFTQFESAGDKRPSMFGDAVALFSDKHMALGIAAIVAIAMLVRYAPKQISWTRSLQDAMLSAGNIVLITAAGGAFGHVLRQSGIAEAVQQRFPVTQAGLGLLVVAFVVTAIVRVAQGSATVAMITAVGIVAPLVQATELPFPTVFVALAIGCGSKPLPWMNDSGFWVITRMSGMTESESLRTFSVALTIMGVVGLFVTLAGATLFSM